LIQLWVKGEPERRGATFTRQREKSGFYREGTRWGIRKNTEWGDGRLGKLVGTAVILILCVVKKKKK